VPEGQQNQWMQRSIEEALRLAFTVDEVVHSDEEMG
jgi:hypothetical protein